MSDKQDTSMIPPSGARMAWDEMNQEPSESTTPAVSSSDMALVASEMWDVLMRHNLTYKQGLHIMVIVVKMLGQKTGDEVGAFCAFLGNGIKICPELADMLINKLR